MRTGIQRLLHSERQKEKEKMVLHREVKRKE